MSAITTLYSDVSRLGRESEMLDTIVTMMGDDRLAGNATSGVPRRDVLARLAERGFALTAAVRTALGEAPAGETVGPDDARARYRASISAFEEAADRLDQLPDDTVISYEGVRLRRDDLVPQRIAEVVLANNVISSVWTLDEADPDSVRNAIDAMVRRLDTLDDVPSLTLRTMEGDEWRIHGGGQAVSGTREFLAHWLAAGEADGADRAGQDVPRVPPWS